MRPITRRWSGDGALKKAANLGMAAYNRVCEAVFEGWNFLTTFGAQAANKSRLMYNDVVAIRQVEGVAALR